MNPAFIMPDLIRHSDHTVITGFRPSPHAAHEEVKIFCEIVKIQQLLNPHEIASY